MIDNGYSMLYSSCELEPAAKLKVLMILNDESPSLENLPR